MLLYSIISINSCCTIYNEWRTSFCANESMGVTVSLTDMTQIKGPLYTERDYWIDSLLANQFTMSEIEDGTFWKYVSNT